jgi:hypothetical protein
MPLSRWADLMGVSMANGRGSVSNSSGKAATPTASNTSTPTRRWRARVRAARTAWSASPDVSAACAGGLGRKNEGSGMQLMQREDAKTDANNRRK